MTSLRLQSLAISFTKPIREQLLAAGRVEGDSLKIETSEFQRIASQPTGPLPRSEWPLVCRALAYLAKPQDRGIGDVFARIVGPVGGEAFKAWTKRHGIDCGCSARQEWMNLQWPLSKPLPDLSKPQSV